MKVNRDDFTEAGDEDRAAREENCLLYNKGLVKVIIACMHCGQPLPILVSPEDVLANGELKSRGIRKLCAVCRTKQCYFDWDGLVGDTTGSLACPEVQTRVTVHLAGKNASSPAKGVGVRKLSRDEIAEIERQCFQRGDIPDLKLLKMVRSGLPG
ncbi:MAG: hypothetical protein LHW56_01890 [Candidatus Cloacimonetes bacterium]|nr:hypothetical protein [Candidatus Cloacimonadota bacterium]MDY0171638.1 hypothetical protein [Candidatus Cloacimonadaceae bacterium]